ADLHAGLSFGIDLHPTRTIQITPPLFQPAADVTVKLPQGASTNVVQVVTVHAANDGTYTLSYNGTATSPIHFNAPPTGTNSGQAALVGIGVAANVTEEDRGVDRIYRIPFPPPATPSALLVAAPSQLEGTADNGILAAAGGTATAHFSAQLFNQG